MSVISFIKETYNSLEGLRFPRIVLPPSEADRLGFRKRLLPVRVHVREPDMRSRRRDF